MPTPIWGEDFAAADVIVASVSIGGLRDFIATAIAEQRERCARIAEKHVRKCGSVGGREAATEIAKKIRNHCEGTANGPF